MCHSEMYAPKEAVKEKKVTEINCASLNNWPSIFLQKLRLQLKGKDKDYEVHALIDTGSQHSYILSIAANHMYFEVVDSLTMNHVPFGGLRNSFIQHQRYTERNYWDFLLRALRK